MLYIFIFGFEGWKKYNLTHYIVYYNIFKISSTFYALFHFLHIIHYFSKLRKRKLFTANVLTVSAFNDYFCNFSLS